MQPIVDGIRKTYSSCLLITRVNFHSHSNWADLIGPVGTPEFALLDSIHMPLIEPEHYPCNSGLSSMVIDPYGNIFPCVQMRIAAGNLRMQSLKSIWNTSPVFRAMRVLTWSNLPTCVSCELKPMCNRCHGIARVETGDVRAPSQTSCSQALARRLVLIEKGLLPLSFPIPAHLKNK